MAVTGVAALAGTGTQTNASVSSAAAVVQQDADVASVSSSFCHHCTHSTQADSHLTQTMVHAGGDINTSTQDKEKPLEVVFILMRVGEQDR